MGKYIAVAKEFLEDKHNQKKILFLSIFVAAVYLGSIWYFDNPTNDLMDRAKYFSVDMREITVDEALESLSPETDEIIISNYEQLYTTEHVAEFYEYAYSILSFAVTDVYILNTDGYAIVSYNLPDVSSAIDELFPDGVSEYLGDDPTFDDWCSEKSEPIFTALYEALETDSITFETISVQLDITQIDEEWGIILDDETFNTLTGGLYNIIKD